MNLAKTGKKLGITAVMLTTIGAGIAFGENNASAAVDMNQANQWAQQYSNDKTGVEGVLLRGKDAIEHNNTSDEALAQYYGAYKATYGHFPNEATASATTPNASASNNTGAVNSTATANGTTTTSNKNNAQPVVGVNTTDVTKGTELPQTGNDSSLATTALGSLMGLFGLGLAAKKRSL